MNPARDDLAAAHARISQLERELAEKNQLIDNLKTDKSKTRTGLVSIILKSLACVIIGAIVGFGIIEPNSVFVAEGIITKMASNTGVETYDSAKKYTKGFEIIYTDHKGKQIVDLNERENNNWFSYRMRELPRHLWDNDARRTPKVYIDDGNPYIGCKVKVYYLQGAWFGGRSWLDPIVDASMCKKPKSPQVETPTR